MKKVIEGLLYDTEKAECIVQWDNGLYGGDFHRCREDLYKTSKGNYFIHGEGGALSRWSESTGNNGSRGSSGIRPLSEAEAAEWCENHADADIMLAEFPDYVETA